MKQVAITALVILATLTGLLLLWQFREALFLFVISLAITAIVRPATSYWTRRGLPRGLAIIITYLIGILTLGAALILVSRPLFSELTHILDNFATSYENITTTWPSGTPFQQSVAARLPDPKDLYQAMAGGTGLLQTIFGFAQSLAGMLARLSIVIILSIYWTADQVRFERLWLSLLPAKSRTRAREIWRSIELGLGAYLRSELIQSVLAAILLGLGYWIMGLSYPVFLALTGALLWLIPWLGAILAVIMPLLSGLATGPLLGAAAAIYTLLVLLVLEVIVEPRIFNRRRFSSLLIVLFVVAFAQVYGVLGIIIAPPLAAATQIFFRNLFRTSAPVEIVNPEVQVDNLKTRLDSIKTLLDEMEETPNPDVLNLVNRMSSLLDETKGYLHTTQGEEETPTLGLPVAAETRS